MFLTHHHYFQDGAMPYDDLLCHLVFPSQPSTYDNVWRQAASKLQPYSNYGIQWLIFNPTTLKLMDIKMKKIERPLNISYSFYVKLDKIITINLPKTNITLTTSSSILIRMIHQWPKTFNFWSTLIYTI